MRMPHSGSRFSAGFSKLATLFTGTAFIALGAATNLAVAQTSNNQAADNDDEAIDRVVITSSRLKRDGFTAPTPMTTLDSQDFQSQGLPSVSEFLSEFPSFVNNSSVETNGVNSSGNINGGLNLRGIGSARTLVLVNGRRHVPTTTNSTVNTNLIPSSMIERIEVVTGGASAAWGSDAVSGVVNLIYKTDFDGLELDAQYGVSQRGDNEEQRYSLLYGGDVGDRGRVLVAAEYYKNTGISDQSERDWAGAGIQLIPNPANGSENDGIPSRLIASGVRTANSSLNGVILNPATFAPFTSGPLANLQFAPGGGTQPFNRGTSTSFLWTIGGDGTNFSDDIDLIIPNDRKSLFTVFDYDLADSVEFFFEGSFAQSQGKSGVVQNFNFAPGGSVGVIRIQNDNAFLPADVRAAMVAEGLTEFVMGRINDDMGFIVSDTQNTTFRYVVGLNGEFDDNWSWNLYYQFGKNSFRNELTNNRMPANFFNAADAIVDPGTGDIVCRDPVARADGCVPLNLFGFGSPSEEAIAYAHATTRRITDRTQKVLAATVQGDVFELPAGGVSTAFGIEYRKEAAVLTNDENWNRAWE